MNHFLSRMPHTICNGSQKTTKSKRNIEISLRRPSVEFNVKSYSYTSCFRRNGVDKALKYSIHLKQMRQTEGKNINENSVAGIYFNGMHLSILYLLFMLHMTLPYRIVNLF